MKECASAGERSGNASNSSTVVSHVRIVGGACGIVDWNTKGRRLAVGLRKTILSTSDGETEGTVEVRLLEVLVLGLGVRTLV